MEVSGENFAFDDVKEPILRALRKKRTVDNVKKLCRLFHEMWLRYINFYLYKFGIYDNNPLKNELFNEIYILCIKTLEDNALQFDPKVDNFGRIKKYYNKCIEGWLRNRLYKTKKKRIEFVHDEVLLGIMPERSDDFAEVDYREDMRRINKHIREQQPIYQEIFNAVFVGRSREECKRAVEKFKGAVLEKYLGTGKLTKAFDYFGHRVGGVFGSHA